MVGVGHSEQFADDERGHGQGEGRDQVRRPGAGEHLVEEVVHDALHARPHRLDPLHGEPCGDHPPQPRVLGVVHQDEADGVLPDGGAGRVARAHHVGAHAGVGQQRPLVRVARHQPGGAPVPQAHLGQGALLLLLRQGRRRVERTSLCTGHRVLGQVRRVLRGGGRRFGQGFLPVGGAGGRARGVRRSAAGAGGGSPRAASARTFRVDGIRGWRGRRGGGGSTGRRVPRPAAAPVWACSSRPPRSGRPRCGGRRRSGRRRGRPRRR